MSENTAQLLTSFNFRVTLRQSAEAASGISGTSRAPTGGAGEALGEGGFQECSGLEIEMDVQTLDEGGRNFGVIRRVGRARFQNIVLKRGMFVDDGRGNADLWRWMQGVLSGEVRPVVRYDGTTSSFRFGAPRLGALLLHELSHLRDPGGSPMGLGDAVEGFAYAVEMMVLQRILERATPSSLTPAERTEIEDRIRTLGGLYYTPPTLAGMIAEAYRENFSDLLGTLQILFRIYDGRPMTWGPSGPPPGIAAITRDRAEEMIANLITRDSSGLRDRSTPEGALMAWVRAHASEVPWLGLSGALSVLPPPPSSTSVPTRP